MSTGPAEGIAHFISQASPPFAIIGGTADWAIYVGKMIDKPDRQICCYDIAGQPPNPKFLLDYPVVQIVIRGAPQDYAAVRLMAQNVQDVLLGQFPRAYNSDSWDAITVLSPLHLMGVDENDRPSFSTNFRAIIEPAASPYTNRVPL